MDTDKIWDLIFENIKKVVFPEEWLKIDLTLSKQEIFALMLIDRRGELIMSQIAGYINVPMSTATGIVDRLVKNGYLERNRSEGDRRVVMIRLTDKAREISNDIKRMGTRYLAMVAGILTEEEREVLLRIVTKVIAVVNKQAEGREPISPESSPMTKISIE